MSRFVEKPEEPKCGESFCDECGDCVHCGDGFQEWAWDDPEHTKKVKVWVCARCEGFN